MSQPPEEDPRKTPFLSILLYVLGLMTAVGLVAATIIWLLRLFN
jgi:hypothetical protein